MSNPSKAALALVKGLSVEGFLDSPEDEVTVAEYADSVLAEERTAVNRVIQLVKMAYLAGEGPDRNPELQQAIAAIRAARGEA